MLVNLQNSFRSADGIVHLPDDNPHEFPDDFILPDGAEKLSAADAKKAVAAQTAATTEE